MFVSVILDPGSTESAQTLAKLLTFYGYTKKQRSCWEHTSVSEERLLALKKDIDRVTDYYDTLRIYQYPVQGVMAITELNKKKWRKMLMRMSES
ncbi:MAG: CRISPR-associated endonuclease Cas2 [Treponemataceae bacterium]|nr:CRISPR-associated endonuclease Cas2 [Treponemataceae bacterium]